MSAIISGAEIENAIAQLGRAQEAIVNASGLLHAASRAGTAIAKADLVARVHLMHDAAIAKSTLAREALERILEREPTDPEREFLEREPTDPEPS